MSTDRPPVVPPLRRGEPIRRGRGGRASAVWIWVLLVLAVLAVVQAVFIYPLLFLPAESVPGEAAPDPSERRIRVLVAVGTTELVLKTVHDDPEADRRDGDLLDRALFPKGDRHTWLVLCAKGAAGGPEALDLTREPPVLTGAGGSRAPVDLAAALSRAEGLPGHLRAVLSLWVPADGKLVLEPGRTTKALLAYPGEGALDEAAGGRVGERLLAPRTWLKDELDNRLSASSGLAGGRRP